ncbi:MAG: hypothetical protein ACJAYR_003603 [Sneathiella sp.]
MDSLGFVNQVGIGVAIWIAGVSVSCAGNALQEGKISEVSAFSLQTEKGGRISLEEMYWPENASPLRVLRGKAFQLEQENFVEKGAATNKYGDLRGKLIVHPFGWVQAYWAQQGLAVYNGLGPYPLSVREALLSAEREARENRRGLWFRFQVLQAADLGARQGADGFQVVEGRILSVKKSGSRLYLNFGNNWRTDFTASISTENKRRFRKMGWNFDALVNTWVRVRGNMRFYNGPFMELNFPEQVEFLDVKSK